MTNKILLTGAGFTKNFGAPLAKEISDIINNNSTIQKNQKLKEILNNNFDYEKIYQEMMDSKNNTKEKKILNNALQEAYKYVDNSILSQNDTPITSQLYNDVFKKLIAPFTKAHGGSGYIFTLNQDLFIERYFNNYLAEYLLRLPIMGTSVDNEPLNNDSKRILPKDFQNQKNDWEKESKQEKTLSYIKLHGSQDWFMNDNSQMMIIGHAKGEKIKNNPLLSWYFELFESQLAVENTKLLIIGYGFGDPRINEAITKNENLKLFIIDTRQREEFMKALEEKPHGDVIKKLNPSFYKQTLSELFPNSITHPHWDSLIENFFKN